MKAKLKQPQQRRNIFAALIIALSIVIAGVVIITSGAPEISSVADAPCSASGDCLRFPTISGENLPGESFTLPDDLAGERILLIVPFDDDQQVIAGTWLPAARELAADFDGFTAYNVPVFPDIAAPIRMVIRAGMSIAIPDADLRAATITVFLDERDSFLDALNIPDVTQMQAFLIDAEGNVLWRGAGVYSAAMGESLRETLEMNP